MFSWLFKKKPKRVKTLYDFLKSYSDAHREFYGMHGYIHENSQCNDFTKYPSKKIIRRYTLDMDCNGLAWYLLEKYFEGKIKIEDDEKPE